MSIESYADLKADIGRWLHRSDLAVVAPDLIMLAETRLNRSLRVRQMEVAHSEVISSSEVALPADWLEFIGEPMLGEAPLSFVVRDEFRRREGNIYAIMGSVLHVGAPLNEPVTLAFDYYAKIPALSEAKQANWLLADGPDIYLYGALLEAEPYMKNDPRIQTWKGLLQVALTDLQASSDHAKYSGGTLTVGAPR